MTSHGAPSRPDDGLPFGGLRTVRVEHPPGAPFDVLARAGSVSTTTSPSSLATMRPRTRASAAMIEATSSSTGFASRRAVSHSRIEPSSRIASRSPRRTASWRWCVTMIRVAGASSPIRSKSSRSARASRRVERDERLVEERQLGVERERSREARPLRLAAERTRAVPQVGDAEPSSQWATSPRARRCRAPAAKASRDVVVDRSGEEEWLGEDERDPPPVGEVLRGHDWLALELVAPVGAQ